MKSSRHTFRQAFAGLILASLPMAATAGEPAAAQSSMISPTVEAPVSLGDRLENLGRLYKNDDNPILQELWFLGRYHGQYHWSEGSNGEDEGYESRRNRIGGQARLFEKLTLHAQMVSGNDLDPYYNGFTELWIQWAFAPEIALTVGQQKHRFTHDRNVSSRYINHLERSMLTNMFGADYTPAVTLSGRVNKLQYYTGIFSNATGQNMGRAFTDLDSGFSLLAAGYYDLGNTFGADTSHLSFGYLYSDANENATNLDRWDNGFALASILTKGSAALVTELTAGIGAETGDAYGINFQPSYFLTDKLQIAARYQLAGSDEETGLRAQRRYERPAGLPSGDLYQAAYLGLNYHIAKHRIKLMTGIEYATMGGEDVWTASTMVRVFWGPHSKGAFPMAQMLPGRF